MERWRVLHNVNNGVYAIPFRRALLSWFRKNGRDLPWRRTQEPYAILVSEFMLHQTQTSAVIPYYHKWLRRFPDFATLAAAPESDVLHAWQGLGYYSRARNLRATARIIIEEHGGQPPKSLGELESLPGVGRYTAGAVSTFAFNKSVPIIETNICRLLTRLFDVVTPIDTAAGREAIWNHAKALLPTRNAARYNSALMDLGALICKPRPQCPTCPVRTFCRAKNPLALPIKRARPPIEVCVETHSFSFKNGRVLLEQSQKRWRGMWILPRLTIQSKQLELLHSSQFSVTNHRITLVIYSRQTNKIVQNSCHRWFGIDELGSIPLPSPHRRALDALLSTRHKSFARR